MTCNIYVIYTMYAIWNTHHMWHMTNTPYMTCITHMSYMPCMIYSICDMGHMWYFILIYMIDILIDMTYFIYICITKMARLQKDSVIFKLQQWVHLCVCVSVCVMYVCLCLYVFTCVHACVCLWERERERKGRRKSYNEMFLFPLPVQGHWVIGESIWQPALWH